MTFEKVKLSELSEQTVVSFEEAGYTLTVAELKAELKKDDEAAERTWYVVEAQTWQPDAQRMVEDYIEQEYQEMYEDWDERAMDCINDDVLSKIQTILDETFKGSSVRDYWTLEKLIEIDC